MRGKQIKTLLCNTYTKQIVIFAVRPQRSVKGNITNIPLVLGATLSLAIAVLVSFTVLTSVQNATSNDEIKQEPLQEGLDALKIFDFGILFLNGAFYLAAIILAVQIRTSPVFALPSLLFLGVSVWLSSEIANIYTLFGRSSPLTSAAQQFTLTETFFTNLPVITLGLGGLLLIVLYTGVGRSEVTV